MIGEQKTTSALVVIDLQNAIVDSPLHDAERVLGTVAGLLDAAREQGVPVVFVRHQDPDEDEMRAGSDGWQIHPAVAPRRGEPIVGKRAADAFYATPLRSELDARAVTRLVVAGCETQYCIDTTARRALSLDYDVVLAADAHTTCSIAAGGLSGEQIIAHHNALLADLPHPTRGISVVPTGEIAF
jgi:nicotinamidase-related amidase